MLCEAGPTEKTADQLLSRASFRICVFRRSAGCTETEGMMNVRASSDLQHARRLTTPNLLCCVLSSLGYAPARLRRHPNALLHTQRQRVCQRAHRRARFFFSLTSTSRSKFSTASTRASSASSSSPSTSDSSSCSSSSSSLTEGPSSGGANGLAKLMLSSIFAGAPVPLSAAVGN